MKNKESKNSDQKKPIQVRLNPKDGLSSLDKSQNPNPEKTQETIEDAEIVNIPQQMDEIIKNNDKFETVKVLMEILCKELVIPVDSGFPTIAGALNKVWEAYYKSMEEWRELNKYKNNEKVQKNQ